MKRFCFQHPSNNFRSTAHNRPFIEFLFTDFHLVDLEAWNDMALYQMGFGM